MELHQIRVLSTIKSRNGIANNVAPNRLIIYHIYSNSLIFTHKQSKYYDVTIPIITQCVACRSQWAVESLCHGNGQVRTFTCVQLCRMIALREWYVRSSMFCLDKNASDKKMRQIASPPLISSDNHLQYLLLASMNISNWWWIIMTLRDIKIWW